jgi:ElaB/YqjD/DUF883 family membrane-anchored ribosome-binding protein
MQGDTPFAYLARLGVEVRFTMPSKSQYKAEAWKDGELLATRTGIYDGSILWELYREVKSILHPSDEDYAPQPSQERYIDEQDVEHLKRDSFGILTVSRTISSGEHHFFGSAIAVNNFITLRLHTAKRMRSLSNDHFMPLDELFQVSMTHAQWADFVASFNIGAGTPCTIERRVDVSQYIQHEADVNIRYAIVQDFEKKMRRIARLMDDLKDSKLTASGTISMAERKEIQSRIDTLIQQVRNNLPFLAEQFNEQMDRVVTEAKREFEAHRNTYSSLVKQLEISEILALPEDTEEK